RGRQFAQRRRSRLRSIRTRARPKRPLAGVTEACCPPICPRIPPSRPTLVKALVIGRAGSGKVQWGLRRGTDWAPPVRDHEQAAQDRITVEALESHVWRLREDFSRNERASWHQSTLFGRRRRAAKQRGAVAAALHGADGALRLLERRAQGLRRGG